MALRSVEGAPAWLARVLEEVLQIPQPLSARIAKLKTKTTPPPPPVIHSPEPGSETRTAPAAGKGHKEFHFGSTWFCVRKEQRLTPHVWGREPYSSLRRLAAFYPCPQMLAVCYQLDTASEETGSGKDGLQSPSTQHSLGLQLPSGEPNTSEEHPRAWVP